MRYQPFFSYRHGAFEDGGQAFWHARRYPSSQSPDGGTDIYLSLVDLTGKPAKPESDTITVRCTCSNRDLPSRLPFGQQAAISSSRASPPSAVSSPCASPPPPCVRRSAKAAFWRLISHLSLNYLSLVDEGKEALQEILKLYDFTGSPYLAKQVAGITAVSAREHFAPVRSGAGNRLRTRAARGDGAR